jgi:hypothetical protein
MRSARTSITAVNPTTAERRTASVTCGFAARCTVSGAQIKSSSCRQGVQHEELLRQYVQQVRPVRPNLIAYLPFLAGICAWDGGVGIGA